MSKQHAPSDLFSRRDFIKTTASAAVGAAGLMASANFAYAAGSDTIRVGLVGCGGRGSGAARDCVTSAPGVRLTTMADLFEDRLDDSRARLKEALGDAYDVADNRAFSGFDAYKQVLESDIDLVILATPPGFRPIHFDAAAEAGKHVVMEKPASVDPAGARAVIATGERAKQKRLSVVAGTQYRRQPSFYEAVNRIHDGVIGEIVGGQLHYLTGAIWLRERGPGMSDMEWQCRNWYYFTWLSGDHIVEQFVHNLDLMNWVMQGPPQKALAQGGRLVRTDPSYGHIYDHFSVEYIYPNGVRMDAKSRQMEGTQRLVDNRIVGTKGVAEIYPDASVIRKHNGEVLFQMNERGNNPYVQEHTDLVNSIREGKPLNEAAECAASSLIAILGREAAYTGQEIAWDELLNADLDLVPETFAFGPAPTPPVALPGITKLNRPNWAHAFDQKTATH